ncbi:hypothetical protein CNYM01_08141 [Colletotrichum nymphaeae SA-01]|uniref:Uncharacterized protein n=1 Tax=Colletotrichum nymphaeae SA-01 TaxID=1460502 RepID=A0A135UXR8_9PEZI|nr:hypothetical protein CNYM01_08141 [Colletotrichum nymphaeae SA-01]
MSQGGEAITESSNTALAMSIAERSALALVTALALAVLGPPRFLRFSCCATRYRMPQWVRQRHLGRGLGRKGSGGVDVGGADVGGADVGVGEVGVTVGVDGSGEDEGAEGDETPDNVDDDDGDGDAAVICTAIASGSTGGGGSGESGGVINDGPRWLDPFTWRWSAILRPLPLHLLGNVWRWFDLVVYPSSAIIRLVPPARIMYPPLGHAHHNPRFTRQRNMFTARSPAHRYVMRCRETEHGLYFAL